MKTIEIIHQLFLDIRLVKNPVISLGNTKHEKIFFLGLKYLNLFQDIFNTIVLTRSANGSSGNLATLI